MIKKSISTAILLLAFMAGRAADTDSLLRTMSLREKIAQIIIEAVDSGESESRIEYERALMREGLGGIIVMDGDLEGYIRKLNDLQSLARIPAIVSIDGEWGAAMRFYEYAAFPRAMQLGALPDESLVEDAGRAIGEELRELKIFVNYAPVVDVNNNPSNPVINTRSFGEDPERVARFGTAYMKGMRNAGVYGSAKHFPGHGDTDVDSHKSMPVLPFGRERLDSIELYPFRRLIAEGVEMVMVGHLSVPALDSTGRPASISRPIVTDLLRRELGFGGIIITDALQMKGVAEGNEDAAIQAYKAGADILLMPSNALRTIDDLEEAFLKGELEEEGLDARVLKMLELKEKTGILKRDYSPIVDTLKLQAMTVRPETEALIQDLCDKSMTTVHGRPRLRLGKRLFSRKPRTAYVAVASGTPESEVFDEELSIYGKFDRFDLPADATKAQADSVGALLKGYRNVVVCFHAGPAVPHSGGPQRFASVDPGTFSEIASWSRRRRLHGVYFGNPYDLGKLRQFRMFRSFTVSYSDTRYNNRAAARVISGAIPATGSLPVTP